MQKYGINAIMLADCSAKSLKKLYLKRNQPTDSTTTGLIHEICAAKEQLDHYQETDLGFSAESKLAYKTWKSLCKKLKSHLKSLK